jgi:cation:H+ antiporter
LEPWIQLAGGAILLYFGAEWLVGGGSALALALRIPQLLVGLTVVAYGTSAPEIIVGAQAASDGHGQVALGNVIGSNIANIGLILGTAALVRPIRVDTSLRRRELPVLLLSAAVIPWLLLDTEVSFAEAVLLVLAAFGYTAWMIRSARGSASTSEAIAEVRTTEEAADAAGAPKPVGAPRAAATAAVGLGLLLIGGHLFVRGAVSVAHALEVSDRLIGITVVAVGTSLPELVTAVIAARRGHSDLALGNILGSNIFNVLLCLGAAGLAGSVRASLSSLGVDLAALALMTILAAVVIGTQRRVSRRDGLIALGLYGVFMLVTVARG